MAKMAEMSFLSHFCPKMIILGGQGPIQKMSQKDSFWAFISQVFGQKYPKMTSFSKLVIFGHFWPKTCEVKAQNDHF